MELTQTELENHVNCVRLSGRLDAVGADLVGVRFTASTSATGRDTLVDLAQVSFVASMGIRLLIESSRALNKKGAKMVLFGATSLVGGVLNDVALDQVIPIAVTESEALARLAA